jgi:hypothetical protein
LESPNLLVLRIAVTNKSMLSPGFCSIKNAKKTREMRENIIISSNSSPTDCCDPVSRISVFPPVASIDRSKGCVSSCGSFFLLIRAFISRLHPPYLLSAVPHRWGQKTGKGWYAYPNGRKGVEDAEVTQLRPPGPRRGL